MDHDREINREEKKVSTWILMEPIGSKKAGLQ